MIRMGLRANDFDWRDLKGKKIIDININTSNESTVTVEDKDGSTSRHRIPAAVRHLMEAYCTERLERPNF